MNIYDIYIIYHIYIYIFPYFLIHLVDTSFMPKKWEKEREGTNLLQVRGILYWDRNAVNSHLAIKYGQ